MKILLEDIPPEGLEVEFLDLEALPADFGPEVARILEPPEVRLALVRDRDMVVARGEARFGLELTCSRCLAPAAHRQKLPLEMVFRPPDQTREDEVQLGGDELEVIFYQGEEIDLGEAVRAEISLALPMAPLCREDCPGVCPRCGQAIEGPDHACGGPESDPRWVKLGEFKPAK